MCCQAAEHAVVLHLGWSDLTTCSNTSFALLQLRIECEQLLHFSAMHTSAFVCNMIMVDAAVCAMCRTCACTCMTG